MASSEQRYQKLVAKIGVNVRRLRNSRNLSQSEMVDYGFEVRNYQRLESGKHSPSLYTLHRLSEVFDCDIREFFAKEKS